MPSRGSISIEDYSGENTDFLFWVQDMSGANFEAVRQDADEIKDAILTVILGEVREVRLTKTETESVAAVTDKVAQREFKWEISYRDVVQFLDVANTIANPGYNKVFNFEVGTADPAQVANNSDFMDLTAGVGLALKGVLDANLRSPYNHTSAVAGNKVDVLTVRLIGKNS